MLTLRFVRQVEVQREVTATVQVMDAHGHPLLSSFFALMGLRLEPASEILTLRSALVYGCLEWRQSQSGLLPTDGSSSGGVGGGGSGWKLESRSSSVSTVPYIAVVEDFCFSR